MKIFEIMKNPIFKLIGISVILYFGLFYNKNNPESLGNRLSKETLEKDFDEIRKKGNFIITNIGHAKQNSARIDAQLKEVVIQDLVEGDGDEIKCMDSAIISYQIYDKMGQNLAKNINENSTFNPNSDNILEKYLMNMKKGGIREIKIPQNFQTQDLQFIKYKNLSGGIVKYQISLKEITKSNNANCLNNEKAK